MNIKTGKQKFDARVAELRARGFEIEVTTPRPSVEDAVVSKGQWKFYCVAVLYGDNFCPNPRFGRKSTKP